MNLQRIKKVSLLFSIIFLFLLTLIFCFIFIISLKPVKINLLNYFDRESLILKNVKIEEIGDVFFSFNKVSKNFELLIEDLVIEKSYFPNILIGLDLSFKDKFFDMSLKVFDGDMEIKIPKVNTDISDQSSFLPQIKSKFGFLERFNNIQLINNKLKLIIDEDNTKFYFLDLNYKENEIALSVSHKNENQNYLSLDLKPKEDSYEFNMELEKFDFEFLRFIFNFKNFQMQNIFVTGSSKFIIDKNLSINSLFFNFSLDGGFQYNSFKGTKKITFEDSQVFGEKNFDNTDIILDFFHLNTKLRTVLRLNLLDKRSSKLFIEFDNILLNQLLDYWPDQFKSSVYNWMLINSKGKISNFSINFSLFDLNDNFQLNNLSGKFDFYETKIKYMESMPWIINIDGNAKIEQDKVIFFISSGFSNDLIIQNGTVELYDLDTDFEKSNINLNINSKNKHVVDYLRLSPIDSNNYKKLKNIEGILNIDLSLDFPLIIDLPTEKIIYNSEVKIEGAFFRDVFDNYDLDDFAVDISINNENISYNGFGSLSDSILEFKGKQFDENNKLIDITSGTYSLSSTFLKNYLSNNFFNYNGDIDVSFEIKEDDNGFVKIEGIGSLDKIEFNSDFLGPDLDFKNGKLRFLIRPYDDNFSGFIDVKTNNIEIEVNSLFKNDKLVELDVQNFKTPIQDFKVNYKSREKKVFITGKKLTLSEVNFQDKSELDFDDFDLSVAVEEINIAGMNFSEPQINLIKSNGKFDQMIVNLERENDFYKIDLNEKDNIKSFTLESNYIPGLLKIFDFDLNVSRGSIKIEGKKSIDSEEYDGVVAGKNIVFFDAPFFANFFSIFSLEGFTQKLKDGGIIFNNLKANYKLAGNRLKIVDSLLKGSELGIQFDSVIGLNDDYFLMNGSIIPAYTLNTLITKFPIVGEIITAGSPEDGLIGANFTVEKIDGEYEVFYNPISVFVPNIIKNFLGD